MILELTCRRCHSTYLIQIGETTEVLTTPPRIVDHVNPNDCIESLKELTFVLKRKVSEITEVVNTITRDINKRRASLDVIETVPEVWDMENEDLCLFQREKPWKGTSRPLFGSPF